MPCQQRCSNRITEPRSRQDVIAIINGNFVRPSTDRGPMESMKRHRMKRAAFILLALIALVSATASWLLGSELVQPAMHPVPLPIGFAAQQVTIPSQGHAIAGWWIDN